MLPRARFILGLDAQCVLRYALPLPAVTRGILYPAFLVLKITLN